MARRYIDETGNKCGRLTVIEKAPNNKRGDSMWLCKCDCGNEVVVRGINLRSGNTKSCGCYNKDILSKTHKGNQHVKGKRFNRPGKIDVICKECNNIFSTHLSVLKQNRGKFCSKDCANLYRSKHVVQDKHPNWQGGKTSKAKCIRSSKEYKEWRNSVFERDNYTCQKCRQYGGNLNTHHIIHFKDILEEDDQEMLYNIDNGITLCKECHIEEHKNNG